MRVASRVRGARIGASAGLVMALVLAGAPGRAAGPATPTLRDGFGLHITKVTRVDERQVSIDVETAAIQRPTNIRVALPTGYAQHPDQRYPVLYLITGTGGHAADWFTEGKAEQLTAGLPLIVVSTDVGVATAGWFANWQDTTTALGPNQWETYYIDQMIPWIDASFRTRANRDGRAVAGLSQGGFGSVYYPARHPDMFVAAAAMSGAVDIAYDDVDGPLGHSFVIGTETASQVGPFTIFGDPATDEVSWQGHDPTTLLPNLRGMDVWLYSGNGYPGPIEPAGPPNPALMGIEVLGHKLTLAMAKHAGELGMTNVHLVDYGPGTHSWPYWQRDLTWFLPHIMRDFDGRPAAPAPTAYDSIEKSWSQWGWTVSFTRADTYAWSHLSGASSHGFELSGVGTASVVTPAFYKANAKLRVTLRSSAGVRTLVLRAGKRGHLRLSFPLDSGPPGSVAVTIAR
ncbi:MAG TPA: alpha/beta hydrolase family protein [Mycobacteriales bacterium]|nr:alpha/beta hydrolase family protein [Mycobacteriales bacterium]